MIKKMYQNRQSYSILATIAEGKRTLTDPNMFKFCLRAKKVLNTVLNYYMWPLGLPIMSVCSHK